MALVQTLTLVKALTGYLSNMQIQLVYNYHFPQKLKTIIMILLLWRICPCPSINIRVYSAILYL